jgi:hypothetical protein
MAMLEYALTVDVWYELEDLDDPLAVFLYLEGTDPVVCAFGALEPDATSETGILLSEGVNAIPIPYGKSAWLKLLSGAGTVTFSQYGGITSDQSKCAFAYTDTIAVDEVETAANVTVGNDDSVTDQLTYVAFVETVAAGIASAATVDSAVLQLRFSRIVPGQVLRVYGVAESSSQFSTLTDYASLASGLTLTTEFVDVTVNYTGTQTIDITDLLQELANVSGWDATSPIQFWIGCTSSVVTGQNTTVTILTGNQQLSVFASVS